MTRRFRRLVSTDLRGQVAAILLLGLILSQLIAAILYIGLLPRWDRVQRPDEAITRMELLARVVESTPEAQRPGVALLWSAPDCRLDYRPNIRLEQTHSFKSADEDQELREKLAQRLKKNVADVWVEPSQGSKEPDTKRVLIRFADRGALEIITAVGPEYRLARVEQVSIAMFVVFATGGLWAWLSWMVNAPIFSSRNTL